ncbi:MAG: carboxy terminal-processing peptidase [Kiritimatiellae bacterium]|nr:carboxy terminal-processing peptidase [Kiritimatiellia bacterium]
MNFTGRLLHRRMSIVVVLLSAAFAGAQPAAPPGSSEDIVATGRKAARVLAALLPRTHLQRIELDDTIAARAFELFVDSLDFDRTWLMASDVDEFRRDVAQLDDMLRAGDLSFAFRVHERFMARMRDRIEFVNRLLDQGIVTSNRDSYVWRRRDAPRAADTNEWNELWRRKVTNEYISRLVAVELARSGVTNGAATNATAAAAGNTRKVEPDLADVEGDRRDPHLTPEEFIRRRYRQFRTVLEDSDEESLIDRFLSAFSQAFDPHSEYMTAARTEDFDISMRLSLVGIGAQLSSEDGAAKIERLIPGGPAERDGRLQVGDRIIAVGQGDEEPVDVLHWPLYKVVRLIRGEKGTRVTLVYWPASDVSGATERRITLVRDEVKLEEQAAKSRVREVEGPGGRRYRFGVISLPEFYADFKARGGEARRSATDVRNRLQDLMRQEVQGIALDLRNNGGGSLPDAIEIAGLFIRGGPIVQVRDARGVQVLSDPDPELVYGGPLVVLVNRSSASASEIVAAALQDYGRAVIIGDRKTHGKGTVQTLLPLDNRNSALGSLKVTTAAFYRIAGGSTQMRGVAPDIVLPSFLDAMEIGEEFLPHALPWSVVDPAYYAVLLDMVPPLDVLRERSERRRAESPAFQVRAELIARFQRRMNTAEISLNLAERLATARADRELDEAQRAASRAGSEESDDAADLVLQEALQVLLDIARWREVSRSAEPVARAP